MTPDPIWILWVYLAGIPVAWAVGARRVGLNSEEIRSHADSMWGPGERIFFSLLAVFLIGGLWPCMVPIASFFFRGKNTALSHRETERQLTEANAEIERIRQQEGWDKT